MQAERNYKDTNFITGLRAIAISLVFLIHSGGGGLRELGGAYNLFVDFGKYGVPMFFVISGFTIFHQLYSGNYSFSKFLKIRISRISIPYFPIILLIFIYINMGGEQFNGWANKFNDGAISIDNLFAHLTYLASFSLKYANTIIGVEWSLHIEIFFYLTLGYLIANQYLKVNLKSLSFALIVTVFIAILFLYLGFVNKLDRLLVHWMPFRYAWMFVLGGIGYYYRNIINIKLTKQNQYKLSNVAILLSIMCVFILLNLKKINGVGVINEGIFATLTFILIVFVRDSASLSVILNNKVLNLLGSISFSFYLLHFIVIQTQIANYFATDTALLLIINFAFTALISYLWFRVFEVMIYKKAKSYIVRAERK
jgi:peptidoglycan/LPS O-acetylase OafA/YrhL